MSEALPNDSIIRKIQLLLNLGRRGGSEAEATLAMEKAQELLAKYNLDLAIVEESPVAGGTVIVKEKRERTKLDRTALYKWQRTLCEAIAKANFCWHWVVDSHEVCPYKTKRAGFTVYYNVKRHVILGRESNVVACQMMYDYLVETMGEILPYAPSQQLSKSANSWKEGCADRLAYRIADKAWRMQHAEQSAKTEVKETGLRLYSHSQREHAANYDALYGEGSHAAAMVRYHADIEAANATEANQSPEEKAKAEKEAKKQQDKRDRQERQKWDNRDQAAYRAGRQAGDTVSLQDRLN